VSLLITTYEHLVLSRDSATRGRTTADGIEPPLRIDGASDTIRMKSRAESLEVALEISRLEAEVAVENRTVIEALRTAG